ncbi:cardiomyopathy-associated protein 5-like [Mustelus asterias]
MENLEACFPAETADKIEPEISFTLEDETCEGGVLETEEEEELGESLKDIIKDQSVKPKVNYIMSSSSFSMLTVQSEDSGIIWETVSSSRSSTPWASESTASDVYSVDGNPTSAPPGKVIFIMDELPQSPCPNGRQGSKTEKRHIEVTDLKVGEFKDALRKSRNNTCVLRAQPAKSEPTVIFNPVPERVAKPVQDSNKTKTDPQLPIEHSPTVSKIVGKSNRNVNEVCEVFSSVPESVQQHTPVHCQRKLNKNPAELNKQHPIVKNHSLNNLLSTPPEQQISTSSVLLRKKGESEAALKHFSEARISSTLPENQEDSRLSETIISEPAIVSQGPWRDTDDFISADKDITTNGATHTGTDGLKKTVVAGSDIHRSPSHETFILDFKSLALDMDPIPGPLMDNSSLNESPSGKIFVKEDQSYSDGNHPNTFVTSSSELSNPLGSLSSVVTCKETDNSISTIGDKGTESVDAGLKNLSCASAGRTSADMTLPYWPEKQEATIRENPLCPRTNPEPSGERDVELNGSLLSATCRAPEDASQSQVVELPKTVDERSQKEETENQRAIFNIVAEGSEILNIVAPAQVCSVDQEACSKMQDNLIYLQTSPIMKRRYPENNFTGEDDEQQTSKHSELEQSANPSNSWIPNPFIVDKSQPSSVVHSNPSCIIASNPSIAAEPNPSHAAGSNPFHPAGPNPSHPSGSNHSHAAGSNPSYVAGSNPPTTETSNPSVVARSNPSSTEQSSAVPASKGGRGDEDYFEKYTLVDEQVPADLETVEPKSQEVPIPEADNPTESKLESMPFSEDTEVFNFDEFEVSGNPGSLDGAAGYSVLAPVSETCNDGKQEDINKNVTDVLNQKEAGSLLFSTDEGVLSRCYNFPISTKLIDLALLEEPPALAFYYKDLYEEAKGRKEQNSELSDEDSSNPELSFPCQSSDTDDGNGLYFEKYVLRDDVLESSRESAPKELSYKLEAESQSDAVGAERTVLFSESEGQFPELFMNRAKILTQRVDSGKVSEAQKDHKEKSETGENTDEGSGILSEIPSVKHEEVSEEPSKAIELMEEHINELVSEEMLSRHVASFDESLHVEDVEKPASNVENHLDTGQLANIGDSFGQYGNPPSEAGLEAVNITLASVKMQDTEEDVLNEKKSIGQIKADILEQEQSAEQEELECRPEIGYPPAELGQETKHEGSGESIKAENKLHDHISNIEPIVEIEEVVPQIVIEEHEEVDHTVKMEEEASREGIPDYVDQQLHLELAESPGTNDKLETLDVEMTYPPSTECVAKEEINLANQSQEKTIGEASPQIMNDMTVSGPDNYKAVLGHAKETQEGYCLTEDIVQDLQSECKPLEVVTQGTLNDIMMYERDSMHIPDNFQTEYKTETEQDSQTQRKVSEPTDSPQQHYAQEIVPSQADEADLYESPENLFGKAIEESRDLLADVKSIDDGDAFEICDGGLDVEDKELQELAEDKTEGTHVEAREDVDVLISPKPPKPPDTFCVTCGLPISAIDKLFGEHQDHDVMAIDTAVVKVKEQLDECVQAAETRTNRTEEIVTELEDVFNVVEENCTKEEKCLEEQHEEVMKLLLSQYTEMSQVLEEEKKVKLDHLYDQMAHYRCGIESAKQTVEKTKESFQLDDMTFLKSFRMINDSVITALEVAISMDLKPSWCSSFEEIAVKSARPGFESLKSLPVPQSPTIVPQEPNTATSTTITVYWTVGKDDVIDYFQVYCMDESEGSREQSGSIADEYKMAVKESYCTLDNLEPNRCYLVWVMAVNFAGCSLPSEKVVIQTVPSAPIIKAEECTVCWDNATIRWTSADLEVVEYFILEFHRQSDFKKSTFRSITGIRGCELSVRLQPLENFLFFVKAVNALGSSDTSKPALISTKNTRFQLNKATVPPYLQLSEDGTVIHFDELAVENESCLTECSAVLGESLPARGRHYWEAIVDRCEAYRIGIANPITTRSSSLGKNRKLWCMRYYAVPAGHRYEFLHDGTSHDVLITDFPARVGVFVNCDVGQLSFFNAQSGQLLHTFQHQFTDFICPAFVVERPGFLTVCTGVELPEFAKCS